MAFSSANSFCSQFTGECEDHLSAEASGEHTASRLRLYNRTEPFVRTLVVAGTRAKFVLGGTFESADLLEQAGHCSAISPLACKRERGRIHIGW